jgi:hypothetical protein
LLWSIGQDR